MSCVGTGCLKSRPGCCSANCHRLPCCVSISKHHQHFARPRSPRVHSAQALVPTKAVATRAQARCMHFRPMPWSIDEPVAVAEVAWRSTLLPAGPVPDRREVPLGKQAMRGETNRAQASLECSRGPAGLLLIEQQPQLLFGPRQQGLRIARRTLEKRANLVVTESLQLM